jgi:hypothetical protein
MDRKRLFSLVLLTLFAVSELQFASPEITNLTGPG